jgi:hypothetical protein
MRDFGQVEVNDHPPKKSARKSARFVQGHRPTAQDGDDDARKARPGTDVEPVPFLSARRSNWAPSRMCRFQSSGRCSGHQILPLIFVDQ